MMHSGRHRMKSHGGIPQGSTCGFGSELMIYYQFNTGETGELWEDQSPNGNDAAQETESNFPATLTNPIGGLDFEDTNDAETASHMSFTKFTVQASKDFLAFIVSDIETSGTNSNNCWLSDSGSEVLEFVSNVKHQLKAGGVVTNMIHSSIFTVDASVRQLFIIQRTNGATGNIAMYGNGAKCDGDNNAGSTNPGVFELQNFGVKNNPDNESHWFDGKIYDVGVIKGDALTALSSGQSRKIRDLITNYLCSKHGIARKAND